MCLYLQVRFPDGKSYVGMTSDLSGRIALYERNLSIGKSGQIMDALREFGFDSVVLSVLCEPKNLSKEDMQFQKKCRLFLLKGRGFADK